VSGSRRRSGRHPARAPPRSPARSSRWPATAPIETPARPWSCGVASSPRTSRMPGHHQPGRSPGTVYGPPARPDPPRVQRSERSASERRPRRQEVVQPLDILREVQERTQADDALRRHSPVVSHLRQLSPSSYCQTTTPDARHSAKWRRQNLAQRAPYQDSAPQASEACCKEHRVGSVSRALRPVVGMSSGGTQRGGPVRQHP